MGSVCVCARIQVKQSDISLLYPTDQRVENRESLETISSNSDMKRFLFYKHLSGLNVSTLVSVLYSDWYISTAVENNRPVELCQETAQRHRTFVVRALKDNKKCERQL